MASQAHQEEEAITGINVTPLVDIMLVLLIVFMIAARLETPQSVGVELPRGATAEETPPATLSIIVYSDGALKLDGKDSTLAEIEAITRRESERSSEAQAVVSADKGVSYEKVIDVVDAVRRGGIIKLALAIEGIERG